MLLSHERKKAADLPTMERIFLPLLLLDLQFHPIECNTQIVTCTVTDAPQFPHQYHQSGNLTIGAIVSQFGCLFDDISFSEHPKTKLSEGLA